MKLQRPGRAAAVVGGLVAVSATTVMALAAGTASAAEQGRCTDNVNVRSEPSATSRIVAVCQRGAEVTIGEKRNGFVQLTNLGGWASEQYVAVNGAAAARTTPRATPTPTPGADRRPAAATTSPAASPERRGSAPTTAPATGADRRPAAPTSEHHRPAATEEPSGGAGAAEPTPTRGAVGGLVP